MKCSFREIYNYIRYATRLYATDVTDILEHNDLSQLAQELIQHKYFRTNINQIFDCSNGRLNLSIHELWRIAHDFIQLTEVLGDNRKLAFVASSPVDFGKLRQYKVFFQSGLDVQTRVIRSIEIAKEWIEKYAIGFLLKRCYALPLF